MLLELLMVLAIIGILSGMYMGPTGSGVGSAPASVMYIQRTQHVVCTTNRSLLVTRVMEFQINNGRLPTMTDLEAARVSIPRCPEGGRYYVLDGQVYCTLHSTLSLPPLY